MESESWRLTRNLIGAKWRELPEFADPKDDLDRYLQRFELFAKGYQRKDDT